MSKLIDIILEKIKRDVFSDSDLEVVLKGSDDGRFGLVKRALKKNELIKIRRGLYCLSPKYQRYGIDLFAIAHQIYGPSYVSLESALSYHGFIPEEVITTTSVSSKRSKLFETPLGTFSFSKISFPQVFEGVTREKKSSGTVLIATPEKALLDYIYVYKKDWNSIEPLVESLRIEPEQIAVLSFKKLKKISKVFKSRKVDTFIEGIKKKVSL